MGNTGGYLVFGVLMLVIVPVVMAYLGDMFGEPIDGKSGFGDSAPSFLSRIGEKLSDLGDLPFIGGVFNFFGNMFIGYNLFPFWINIILITIPVFLITRGVVSTSG